MNDIDIKNLECINSKIIQYFNNNPIFKLEPWHYKELKEVFGTQIYNKEHIHEVITAIIHDHSCYRKKINIYKIKNNIWAYLLSNSCELLKKEIGSKALFEIDVSMNKEELTYCKEVVTQAIKYYQDKSKSYTQEALIRINRLSEFNDKHIKELKKIYQPQDFKIFFKEYITLILIRIIPTNIQKQLYKNSILLVQDVEDIWFWIISRTKKICSICDLVNHTIRKIIDEKNNNYKKIVLYHAKQLPCEKQKEFFFQVSKLSKKNKILYQFHSTLRNNDNISNLDCLNIVYNIYNTENIIRTIKDAYSKALKGESFSNYDKPKYYNNYKDLINSITINDLAHILDDIQNTTTEDKIYKGMLFTFKKLITQNITFNNIEHLLRYCITIYNKWKQKQNSLV